MVLIQISGSREDVSVARAAFVRRGTTSWVGWARSDEGASGEGASGEGASSEGDVDGSDVPPRRRGRTPR